MAQDLSRLLSQLRPSEILVTAADREQYMQGDESVSRFLHQDHVRVTEISSSSTEECGQDAIQHLRNLFCPSPTMDRRAILDACMPASVPAEQILPSMGRVLSYVITAHGSQLPLLARPSQFPGHRMILDSDARQSLEIATSWRSTRQSLC
jgi:DNA mismatch repair ATPase MutS